MITGTEALARSARHPHRQPEVRQLFELPDRKGFPIPSMSCSRTSTDFEKQVEAASKLHAGGPDRRAAAAAGAGRAAEALHHARRSRSAAPICRDLPTQEEIEPIRAGRSQYMTISPGRLSSAPSG